VAYFRQGMERQSGAAGLTLMMEYKTEAATQAMLAAGAMGILVCSDEPDGGPNGDRPLFALPPIGEEGSEPDESGSDVDDTVDPN